MIVVIGSNQWTCSLASTAAELTTGLSGQESLPPGEGMLFDLGFDYSRIDINMTEMLFPLDIMFINSNLTVVGVLHDVQPNDEAYFLASNSLGARYFMEVNAGEAASINVGDEVALANGQGDIDFVPEPLMDTIFEFMILAVMVVMMTRMTVGMFKPATKKPLLIPEKTMTHSKSTGNPGLMQPSRTYFTPELEDKLDEIIKRLTVSRERKVNQLFEVMEDINRTRKTMQEQKSPPELPMLLEVEIRTSFMHNYITQSDYNRFVDEIVAIEEHMNAEQWGDALPRLNKLMYSVADVFLVDFPEKTKKEIMDIVKATWRTR